MENMSIELSVLGSGFSTALIVLGCLILLCLALIARSLSQLPARLRESGVQTPAAPQAAPAPAAVPTPAAMPAGAERAALVAAVSAAIAETIGGDVSGLRILSIKKISQ